MISLGMMLPRSHKDKSLHRRLVLVLWETEACQDEPEALNQQSREWHARQDWELVQIPLINRGMLSAALPSVAGLHAVIG